MGADVCAPIGSSQMESDSASSCSHPRLIQGKNMDIERERMR